MELVVELLLLILVMKVYRVWSKNEVRVGVGCVLRMWVDVGSVLYIDIGRSVWYIYHCCLGVHSVNL